MAIRRHDALAVLEEQYRRIFDDAPIGMFRTGLRMAASWPPIQPLPKCSATTRRTKCSPRFPTWRSKCWADPCDLGQEQRLRPRRGMSIQVQGWASRLGVRDHPKGYCPGWNNPALRSYVEDLTHLTSPPPRRGRDSRPRAPDLHHLRERGRRPVSAIGRTRRTVSLRHHQPHILANDRSYDRTGGRETRASGDPGTVAVSGADEIPAGDLGTNHRPLGGDHHFSHRDEVRRGQRHTHHRRKRSVYPPDGHGARHHRRQADRGGKGASSGTTPPGPEAGKRRQAGRRSGSRFQQHSRRHQRIRRAAGGPLESRSIPSANTSWRSAKPGNTPPASPVSCWPSAASRSSVPSRWT